MQDVSAMKLDSSSPFRHLLHTNYIPTFDEAAQIRELCANPLNEIARLEAEISRTQAILQDLQRSHRRLKTSVDAHLALLSPMRNLPPEVLQHIFIMAVPSDRNPVMHSSEAPVLLGRVCSSWRRIAFATPQLWASIHVVTPQVDYSESAISPGEIRRMAMEEWLARSGACPLSISIWVSRAAWGAAAAAAASPFVETILPLANRWKDIELRVPSDSLDSFHYLQGPDVPWLKSLSVTNGGSLARDDWSGNLVFLQQAPQLHALSLTHDGNVSLPLLPWGQLTSLSLSPTQEFFGLNTEMTLEILSQCLNLRMCTLHFPQTPRGVQTTSSARVAVVTLPHLSVLAVRATNFETTDDFLSNLFGSLILPGLQTLEMEDRNGDLVIFPALFGLLSRSPCHLQKLKLTDILTVSPLDLTNLLALGSMNSLIELVIQDRATDEGQHMLSASFIEAMTENRSLCPNLRVVKFYQCYDFSDHLLSKFLRVRSVVGLRSADVSFGRDAESDFNLDAAVQLLAEDGLEVNIRHENDEFWDVLRVNPWEGLYYGR
ncbi:hypothetical protein MVEN_01049000 [Mycena venus]|uniref:F-box domain-containing protein n=1 Tax=Mycena venus TaxID=2733690 RepID=A0A8H6Y3T8_9AGAR|nr:hypothetical protein MVEN_01049000 [Mycena venus]